MMLYIGPDVIAPLASILAAIGGAILIFWRQVKSFFGRVGTLLGRDRGKPPTV